MLLAPNIPFLNFPVKYLKGYIKPQKLTVALGMKYIGIYY